MARPKLTLYCDIISPFAYMAFYMTRVRFADGLHQFVDLEERTGFAIHELSRQQEQHICTRTFDQWVDEH